VGAFHSPRSLPNQALKRVPTVALRSSITCADRALRAYVPRTTWGFKHEKGRVRGAEVTGRETARDRFGILVHRDAWVRDGEEENSNARLERQGSDPRPLVRVPNPSPSPDVATGAGYQLTPSC
jgi:hypothetical protein